jgi:hypothetical protein
MLTGANPMPRSSSDWTMSSETSTSAVRLKPDTTSAVPGGVRLQPDQVQTDQGLHPWQFFVLAALGCATAVTFIARGRGAASVILLSVLMGAVVLVGLAVLRTVRPLVSADEDRTVVIGRRTRAALEREKMLALRAIKELEFDRAMGKVSEDDWKEVSTRLRARAARLMRQLDAGEGYRSQIERELEKRLGDVAAKVPADRSVVAPATASERACASCSTVNDTDARFCKNCGNQL